MSLHRGNHHKSTGGKFTAGDLPGRALRGIMADVKAARQNPKLRSPFGFCGARLSKGKAAQ
jgi:hypothetical protein